MATPDVSTFSDELAHWKAAAQQADDRLRIAFELGRLGTWDWNIREDRITRTGYHEQLFGLGPGTFPGTYESFLKCVHHDDREPVKREVARCLALRQDYQQEYRVVWPDGTSHWIEGRARLRCDEHGEPVRMIGVVQDITARKLIEQHQARFRALFEAAQDAVLIADDDHRYIDANPAAGALLGLPPEQLRGRRIEDFVVDVRGEGVDHAWGEFKVSGVQRGECRMRRADGTFCEVEYSAKTDFAPGLHLSILRDVTERKLAEEALTSQAAELRRSNADLQQFAYITSHDLQEPLRAIISFSQMLTKRYGTQLGPEADEFLGYIVSGAYRMNDLISSLLNYSRLVNVESMPYTLVPLEVGVQWAMMNLHTVIEETQTKVTYDPLPTVMADQIQLVQLFQNLIGNAIKYRKPAEPPRIHISARPGEKEWVVRVRDNGIGIHPEHAQRIFGVFKRLHGKEIPGTGIGLAICKRIVEKHGGRIWVESDAGEGARFYFTIPDDAAS
jgi:PAS domain S-box-containing protein